MMTYEWVIIGGGVTGIVLSEILSREGHSVLLVDKSEKLSGETTRTFHEWIHTGCLYTLVPDRLFTLKFLLGAIDDLLEYYSAFERMNLFATDSGLRIEGSSGWFNPNYIHFKYRIRKLNLPWLLAVSRSMYLIDLIKKHDWLRRRGGKLYDVTVYKQILEAFKNLKNGFKSEEKFLDIQTSDFTTNSSILLRDIIATALHNHMELSLGNSVIKIENHGNYKTVVTDKQSFKASNVAICAGKNIPDFMDVMVKTTIAPMAVVSGLDANAKSFVELDCITRNCINLITKPNGVGLIGGISMNCEEEAGKYLDYVIKQHKKLNNSIKVVGKYFGYKNELTFKNEDRNYLYHIVSTEPGIWAIVPGKFTLGFSLAVEFYRKIYKKNPRKFFNTVVDSGDHSKYVSDTLWYETINQQKGESIKNGDYKAS